MDLPKPPDPAWDIVLEEILFYRADGNCICDECDKTYYEHPWSEHLGWQDIPFLRTLCNGDLVKL